MPTLPRATRLLLAAVIVPCACTGDDLDLPPDDPIEDVETPLERCLDAFPEAPGQYEALLTALCSEHGSIGGVGVSVAIAERGRLTFSGGYGRRCADRHGEVDGQTRYRIGSVTKLLTALTAAEQARLGALDLDAKVTTLLPDYHPGGPLADATLRQLLLHTSGLGELDWKDPALWRDGWQASLARATPTAPPGTRWRYSNAGYYLAGAALAGGDPGRYPALVERHALAPLGLGGDSVLLDERDPARVHADDVACDHVRWTATGDPWAAEVSGLTPLPPEREDAWMIPAGGGLASVADLVALALAVPTHPAWDATRAEGPALPGLPGDDRRGLVGRVHRLSDGAVAYRQTGNTGAQTVELHWVPARGFAFAIAGNTGKPYRATVEAAFRTVLRTSVYGAPPPAPEDGD